MTIGLRSWLGDRAVAGQMDDPLIASKGKSHVGPASATGWCRSSRERRAMTGTLLFKSDACQTPAPRQSAGSVPPRMARKETDTVSESRRNGVLGWHENRRPTGAGGSRSGKEAGHAPANDRFGIGHHP